LGARFIDFITKTVAITEKMPMKTAIIKVLAVIEKSIFGASIKNIRTEAAPYKTRQIKSGFF